MSTESVSSSSSLSYLYEILGIDKTSTSSVTSTTETGTESSDTAAISKSGSFLQQLASLQQSDNDTFKTVAQNIADDLTAEAEAETDPQRQQMLTELAAKFSEAAASGEMPDLRPPDSAGNAMYGPPPGDDSGGLLGELESLFESNLASVTASTSSDSSSSSTSSYV